MQKIPMLVACVVFAGAMGQAAESDRQASTAESTEVYSWCGQYCMSFFVRARSAKTVGKDHLSVSLKVQHFDWEQVRGADDEYHGRPSGQQKQRLMTVLCTKYGWAEDHHIALGQGK
jgi:hypothetical protein